MNYRLVPKLSLSYLAATLSPLTANPIDPTPTVVAGQVEFAGMDTHSAVITQSTQQAIVDYSHFNIPEGSSVQFIQPNAESALLNRISGADPSVLNGSLTANGQIYFINPAGVTFGQNSVVRADVFMAAAGQISNADFLNNVQNFSLSGNVINHGSIQTENGVGLFGKQVENTGEIVAKKGYAIVASGDEVHVRQGGTGLAVDVTESAKATQDGTGIRNLGTVDGEEVMFSAGDAFATAIQQSGKVKASRSAKIHSDGGKIEVSGEITARNDTGQGGRIEVGGTDLGADTAPSSSETQITSTAILDASSDSGKGGHIVVWSDGHTDFSGVANATSRSGEGGFIEASGKTIEFANIANNILLGSGGHFLLDPEDITIDVAAASDIENRLNNGESVSYITNSVDAGNGDITVEASIIVPTNTNNRKGVLTLGAIRDITVNGGVTIQNVQEGFTTGEDVFVFNAGRDIILSGELRHSGDNNETGRGSISLTALRDLIVEDVTVDTNGGSLSIIANSVTVNGLSGSLVSGITNSNEGSIDITAPAGLSLTNGGRIETYGGSDIFIDTGLLINGTGSTAITRRSPSESFFAIRLPNPMDNGVRTNHQYGGISSGSRALYNVTDFTPIKTSGISGNKYYYANQPTISVTAKNGVKTYGNTFPLSTGAAAVTVDTSTLVAVPLGNPFLPDTTANMLNLTGVTTSSTGAVVSANVGTYDILPTGATSNNGYRITNIAGALAVNPRAVTLTANPQGKQYGDVLSLDGTKFSVADLGDINRQTLPNGNVINSVGLVSLTGIDRSTTAAAANYPDEIEITGQSGSGGFDPLNYAFTYRKGALMVNRRNVTVTASEQTKYYGDVLDLTSNASKTAFTILDNGLTNGGDNILPNSETIETVTLQSALPINGATSTTEPVGVYDNELVINGVSGGGIFDVRNYNLTFLRGDLVISPRPITVTPSNQSKQYGDVLPLGTTAFTILDNGLTNGNDAILPNGERITSVTLLSNGGIASSTDADVAIYDDNINVDRNLFTSANGTGGFNANNYEIIFTTGDLAIVPRQIELIAGRQEKFYGDTLNLDNTTFTVIDQGNDLDSTLPNNEQITTVTINSANNIDSSTVSDAALYSNEIVISSPVTGNPGTGDGFLESNYNITFTSGDLLVKPRPITVAAVQQEKIYGNTLTLDPTAFTVTDLDGGNILPNNESIDTVNVISRGGHDASTTSAALTYIDDLEVTSVATSSLGFDLGNYSIDFSNLANFVINRRAVTLTALQQEKDYGDVHTLDPAAFRVTDLDNDSDLPNGETIDIVTLVSADGIDASTDADVATYADNLSITPTETGAPTLSGSTNFNQENYLFSYETGDFVINKRAITLTASQQEKIYGNTLTLDDTAFTTLDKNGGAALPNGEVVTNVTINSANGIDLSTDASVATYTDEIVISGPVTGTPGTGDGFLEGNYDITYVEGDLKINKRPITVAAVQQEKIYGNTLTLDPTAFTVTDLDGGNILPNNESIDTVNVISRGGHDASTTSAALTYIDDLEVTSVATSSLGFDLGNYSIDFSNLANFVINRRAVTLTALQQEKDYGDVHTLDPAAFRVTDLDNDSDLPNGETIDIVTLVSADGIDASTDADVATYADNLSITPTETGAPTLSGSTNFNQENYLFSYETGDFVINKRAITLTASQQEKIYGNTLTLDDTAFTTLDKNGGAALPNGEVVTNVTINSANGIDLSTDASVATYTDEIVISGPVTGTPGTGDGFLEGNYDITYVEGDLKINKRSITLTATLQDKVYGESVAASTSAFTVTDLNGGGGLPNGETIDSVNIVSVLPGDSQAPVGVYPDELVPTNILTSSPTFDEANYNITRVNGEYIISQRAILLSALDQGKVYGDSDSLDPTLFTVTDIFGGGGSTLPNNETVSAVSFEPTTLPGDTTALSGLYSDEIVISNQSGSNGFLASNYDISYAPSDYSIGRRSIELVINDDKRYAGAAYQIDPTAFVTIDLDSDNMLPNGESVDSLLITSLTGVAENPAAPMGVYPGELTADPLSAVGSNGFDLENYSVTITPGEFEIEPFPGLAAIGQDIYIEQWIRDNIGYNPEDPFANSYAISQSLGVRILSLDSWAGLSPAKKQSVLSALDAIPLHLQTLDLAKRLIDQIK